MAVAHTHRAQVIFFGVLLVAVAGLALFIFLPYAAIIFLMLVFGVVFRPLSDFLSKRFGGRSIGAGLTLGIICLFILLPLTLVGFLVFKEASDAYTYLVSQDPTSDVKAQWSHLESYVQAVAPNASVGLEQYLKDGLSLVVRYLGSFFTGLIKAIFSFFLLAIGLFYIFRDGSKLEEQLLTLGPLDNEHTRTILERTKLAVNSVVRGFIVVALIQGCLVGIGFFLFGVPTPVLGGLVAVVAALVPTVGTALVIVPAILYLFLTGHLAAALGLLAWGIVAVGLVDNILGPILMRRGARLHPFVILLSVLGGVSFFGPIGFLAGPVVVSLLVTLFDVAPLVLRGGSTARSKA